jgi:hypothetical protein
MRNAESSPIDSPSLSQIIYANGWALHDKLKKQIKINLKYFPETITSKRTDSAFLDVWSRKKENMVYGFDINQHLFLIFLTMMILNYQVVKLNQLDQMVLFHE